MTRNKRRALRLSLGVAFAAGMAGFPRFPRQARAVFRALLYAVVFPDVALIVDRLGLFVTPRQVKNGARDVVLGVRR
jgi:hypothetical protein